MQRILHTAAGGTRSIHLGGWKKQKNDDRDSKYSLKSHRNVYGVSAPKADLTPICSPIEDQGELGSCTAHMSAALVEANENRKLSLGAPSFLAAAASTVVVSSISTAADGTISYQTTVKPAVTPAPTPTPAPGPAPTPAPTPGKLIRAARLFQYYATRKIEGTTSEDSGASIRDAVKAMAQYGVADEATYPYDVAKFAVNPPPAVWTAAAAHKIVTYHSIADGDIETMKAILSAPIPYLIGFGFSVYDSFMSAETAKTGLVGRPAKGESLQGGHAVALVGYDDTKAMPDGTTGAFLVRNSWGTAWGIKGYFWMSYAYVKDTTLCSDFWVVVSSAY